jgi:Na+-translocating ferredoxin:NAD+ oxidoreductase RnfC subunit
MYDYRKVPTSKLKQRLDIMMFRDEAPMSSKSFVPTEVRIPLDQHLGAPAVPAVKEGQRVRRHDLIGIPGGKVSAAVHASVDGVVTKVTNTDIHLRGS